MSKQSASAVANILTALNKRRADLAAEIGRVDGAIAALTTPLPPARPRGGRQISARDMTYAEALEVALGAAHKPQRPRELRERLEAMGRPVGGKKPQNTLYNSLANSSRFVKLGPRWALVKWGLRKEAAPRARAGIEAPARASRRRARQR
jgi:hypothetical protein